MKKIALACLLFLTVFTSLTAIAQMREIADPDSKLSIIQLKNKYPVSLLDVPAKKYKSNPDININNYTNPQIKAAFLNADKNFRRKDDVIEVIDSHQDLIIQKTLEEFGFNAEIFDKKEVVRKRKTLRSFVCSKKITDLLSTDLNRANYENFVSDCNKDLTEFKHQNYN